MNPTVEDFRPSGLTNIVSGTGTQRNNIQYGGLGNDQYNADSITFNNYGGEATYQSIKEWLATADPWTAHNAARRLHENDTGSWLVQSDEYKEWKQGSRRHLWLHGKPGCGKTILCSTLIQDLMLESFEESDVDVAFFYFSFSDDRAQSYDNLLRSVIIQLASKALLVETLRRACENQDQSVLTHDALENVLELAVGSKKRIHLVIDALDESPEGENVRQSILDAFERLIQRLPSLSLLVTSRYTSDIFEVMTTGLKCQELVVTPNDVDRDILRYVKSQLARDRRLSRFNDDLQNTIQATIMAKADGMFRWAHLQLQELRRLKVLQPSFVRKALNNLPATLDETYKRMLVSIEPEYREIAIRLLQWLTYARRPLQLSELTEVAIIDLAGSTIHTQDRGDIGDALNILAGLVVLIKEDSSRYYAANANFGRAAATRSRVIASHYADAGGRDPSREFSIPESVYQAHHGTSYNIYNANATGFGHPWSAHTSLHDYPLTYSVDGSITRPNRAPTWSRDGFERSISSFADSIPADDQNEMDQQLQPTYTIRLAHFSVQEYLESSRVRMNEEVKEFHLQSTKSHHFLTRCCSLILKHYSDDPGKTNDREDILKFPLLQYAAQSWYRHALRHHQDDHEAEVKLLQDKKVVHDWLTIHSPERNWRRQFDRQFEAGSGLYYASLLGLEAVAATLLSQHADPNTHGGHHGNALQAASCKGLDEVVKLLLEHGADPNAQGGFYKYALQAAAFQGRNEVVDILLKHGADVNAQGGLFDNALQAAAFRGHNVIVQELLARGAVDTRSSAVSVMNVQGNASESERVEEMLREYRMRRQQDIENGEAGNTMNIISKKTRREGSSQHDDNDGRKPLRQKMKRFVHHLADHWRP